MKKLNLFVKGLAVMAGSLIGIKRLGIENYSLKQFYIVGILFMLSSPPILFFWGSVALICWLGILFGMLALLNVDEILMLSYLFSEFGVEKVLALNNYREWIDNIYQESAAQCF